MTEILIIIGLILLNGFFSMAEIALVSARKARLESQASKGDKQAKEALLLSNHPETFLSTVQIGITLIGILLGIFSGERIQADLTGLLSQWGLTDRYSHGIATVVLVILVTYLTLVVGELVPKRIGMSKPESIAKIVAAPMHFLSWIMHPFVVLLTKSSNILVKLLGVAVRENTVTEDEIKAIINEGTEQGTIEEAEQEIIERIFHLGDRNITSLMTHRNDIVWLDINHTDTDVRNVMRDEIYSLYPLCDGNIDNTKGVVFLKDIFLAPTNTKLSEISHQAFFVPENISAYQLLEKLKESNVHYAFIVDEYGTFQGLVTLNDIMDAIVGDMLNEDETPTEIVRREDGSYLIDAQLSFYDFLNFIDKTEWLEEDENEFDTLAGFMLHHLEHIPKVGEKLTWHGYNFEIVDMDNHRIDKILVGLVEEEEESA